MISDADYDLVAREANFRWGASVSKYDVQEILEGGRVFGIEQYEIEAIRREACENGIR